MRIMLALRYFLWSSIVAVLIGVISGIGYALSLVQSIVTTTELFAGLTIFSFWGAVFGMLVTISVAIPASVLLILMMTTQLKNIQNLPYIAAGFALLSYYSVYGHWIITTVNYPYLQLLSNLVVPGNPLYIIVVTPIIITTSLLVGARITTHQNQAILSRR